MRFFAVAREYSSAFSFVTNVRSVIAGATFVSTLALNLSFALAQDVPSEIPLPTPQQATPTPDFFSELENLPQEIPTSVATQIFQPEIILDGFLFGPGMGWQTCERPIKPNCGGPECASRSAYFKFFWSDLEWAPGAFDFTIILEAAAKAAANGQQLDLRPVMPYAPEQSAPRFLETIGARGEQVVYNDGESRQEFWIADLNDPSVRESYINLIHALGQQFDLDPRIGIVDISIFGLWGEGHIGDVWPIQSTGSKEEHELFAQNYVLTNETRQMLVDAYFDAFPNKLKVAQIADVETLRYAVTRGAGVRLDCLGGYFMESNYPRHLEEAGALDAWKTAPVVAEVCGSLSNWAAQWGPGRSQYNELRLDEIFSRAETLYHLSSLNAKNADEGIPEQIQPRLFQFLQKVGYRFELRKAEFAARVASGEDLQLRLSFTNAGIAPSYNPNHVIAVKLINENGELISIFPTNSSIAGRLPGEFVIEETIPLLNIAGGYTRIAIAVVDKTDASRAVLPLAIQGGQDGWYEISGFEFEGSPIPEPEATPTPEVIEVTPEPAPELEVLTP